MPMLEALMEIALDLTASLSTETRYQRLLAAVRRVLPCDAVALLRLERGRLIPVVAEGLEPDALGRTFDPSEHPRLQAILESRQPVRFPAADPRPDPYDDLIAGIASEDLRVHSCMGCSLRVGGDLVGVVTVDALQPGAFDEVEDQAVATLAALAAATIRTASLIDALEELARRRGAVANQLVAEALARGGGEIIGQSDAIRTLKTEMDNVAGADLTVLITGETGTGKELVARTIHARSSRAGHPLVYVNCAALPETIAESELFGHRKGAFTGATADRAGKFELAHGGTLFLDEVGDLPLSIQPKLLRALQFGEVQRVGDDREHLVDVRVLAATNRDLQAGVKAGEFRADLYHRLSVYLIDVPPLRDRAGDIALLAGFFLDRAQVQLGLGQVRLAAAARAALERSTWPGNVRELEHVILRGSIRARAGRHGDTVVIEAAHLDLDFAAVAPVASTYSAETPDLAVVPFREATDSYQRSLIARAVEETDGNWAGAARLLGLDRSNLHRIARRLGMKDG
jgi:anaerobic nitric oxide reductase transcription regulator